MRAPFVSTATNRAPEVVGTPDDFSDFRDSLRNFERSWTVNPAISRLEIS